MPQYVLLDYAYILPRFAVWTLLFVVAFWDGWRHRGLRSKGYQLYFALVGVIFLYVIGECLLLAYAVETDQGADWAARGVFNAFIFFSALADSVWFGILLAISAGYCITRNNLGPHKPVVISIPIIFFVTSLVVNYVLFYERGILIFDVSADFEPQDPNLEGDVNPFTGLVFFICLMANMMAYMLSWFYIFDTIQKEREMLESNNHGGTTTAPAPELPGVQAQGVGHLAVPDGVLLEEGATSHLPVYGNVVDEDLDAPKTVQERIQHREKIRLMRQFFYGVSFYVVATLLVLFLPIFVSSVVDKTMLILQNAVLWLFLACLCFIFRMREDNPYLMLDEEAGDTGLGGVETTTELGVMLSPVPSNRSDIPPPPPAYNRAPAKPRAAHSSVAAAAAGPPPLPLAGVAAPQPPLPTSSAPGGLASQDEEAEYSQPFTLGDEEEDEQHRIMRGPSSTATPNVNVDAARQGVVVTTLPSPKID